MTRVNVMGQFYEKEFEDWHKNRMSPLTHKKGVPMKITDKHLKAIARAQHFVRSGITVAMQQHHREQIETDIYLLDQVHTYCRHQINEPCLPMSPESTGQNNNGEKDGDTDNSSVS